MPKRVLLITALVLSVFSFSGLMPRGAQAQALKAGYTDSELIVLNMPEYRQIQEKLQQEYQTGQKDLQTQAQQYQEKLDRYQKQQALLSAESRQEREQELVGLQTQLQQAAAQKEQALQQRESELMQPLLERVQQNIDVVAKEKGLDIVFRSQMLLYVDEGKVINITEDVARKLGLTVDETASKSN